MIVDFWATWCGPCKQLGPALEKAVLAAKGAVKLVKIDVDKNPVFAGQLRVQSIPTVYAFVDGQPVDGFMGAVPESQMKAFIERLVGHGRPVGDRRAAGHGQGSRSKLGDIGGAAQAYAQVLQADAGQRQGDRRPGPLLPGRRRRRARRARSWPWRPRTPRTPTWTACAPRWRWPPRRRPRPPVSSSASPPIRTTTRRGFELAKALAARGQMAEAADQLLDIIDRDRDWNDEAARKQLLTVFEAAGATSEVAKPGRRRLSSILFS